MSGTAVHIPSIRAAMAAGEFPGEITSDGIYVFPVLHYTGARGAAHTWRIQVQLLHDGAPVPIVPALLAGAAEADWTPLTGHIAEIRVESSQVGGKVREVVPTYVDRGKNLGKKNATNPLTQALRDALGLYNKQRKRADITDGPGATAATATTTPTTPTATPAAATASRPAERPLPQLVKKLDETRDATLTPADFVTDPADPTRGISLQKKLNGVRCVVYQPRPDAPPQCYSRNGHDYPGRAEVTSEVAAMFAAAPAVQPGSYGVPADAPASVVAAYGAYAAGAYLDGEIYRHGRTLNEISGQARSGEAATDLQYNVFDVFFPAAIAAGHDMASAHRQLWLAELFARADAAATPHPDVVRVPAEPVASREEITARVAEYMAEGYEGGIARKNWAGYRYGTSNYHSSNLVKVKALHDAEFPCVGYTQGDRGKDVGALVWVCAVPEASRKLAHDYEFNVVPKNMTYEQRYKLFKCLGERVKDASGATVTRFERDVKSRPLTIEYPELSPKTGKPLQAKATVFRTYEDAGPDPIAALFASCGI